jgi:hypothetical protein
MEIKKNSNPKIQDCCLFYFFRGKGIDFGIELVLSRKI